MDIVHNAKLVITDPEGCWKRLKNDSLRDTATYLAVMTVIAAVLSFLIMMGLGVGIFAVIGAPFFFAMYVAAFLLSFVMAWVTNFILELLGVKGNVKQALQALAYGYTPAALFGWIPALGILAALWALVLQVMGLKELYGTTYGKVILALLIEFAIVVVIFVVVSAVFGLGMLGLGVAMMSQA